jgi:hypothetical protein
MKQVRRELTELQSKLQGHAGVRDWFVPPKFAFALFSGTPPSNAATDVFGRAFALTHAATLASLGQRGRWQSRCTDLDVLKGWLRRAATVGTTDALFE